MIIESSQNPKYKMIKALGQKSKRTKTNRFLAEGLRFITDGLEAGWTPDCILIDEEKKELYGDLAKTYGQVPFFWMKSSLFKTLSDTQSSQGILAVFEKKETPMPIHFEPSSVCLLLDRIQDPGNLGTILRSANAFGIHSVFLAEGSVDLYNPKVLRATMGAIFHLNIIEGINPLSLLDHLKPFHFQSVGLWGKAPTSIHHFSRKKPLLIVVGNEANGISAHLSKALDVLLRIDMKGHAESLNAGVAASIALYELCK